ncbi:MAG: YdcF family protein [Novosphingobium sp.]
MTRFKRLGASVLLAYLLGFLWFALMPPQGAGLQRTDAIVVYTGGEGRIGRALEMLGKGQSRRLFVAGVDKTVRPREFAAEYGVSGSTMACCVVLDFKSVDTISNAGEAAFWIAANKIRSVRLVTSDWHMRRAALELARVAPSDLVIVRDAVTGHPSFETLVLEYNKFLARSVTSQIG